MFYRLIKFYARLAIRIYCRKVIICNKEVLKHEGPILLACNHPNSFLDGIIITTLFEHPVHSLARGDAFKNKWVKNLLYNMRLLPVYRTSEGVENLEHNYSTFDACINTFRQNEIVLIFSEGRCENEWHLRPLKKGTARLAVSAWEKNIPLTVIPTAINYNSFKRFGKEVHLSFGNPILRERVMREPSDGKQFLQFNEALENELKQMVYEIEPGDHQKRKEIFNIRKTASFFFLLIPAILGVLLHAAIFIPVNLICYWRFYITVHFDSVQTSLLLLTYPFYWILICILSFNLHFLAGTLMIFLLPFTAWAAVRVKYQLDI